MKKRCLIMCLALVAGRSFTQNLQKPGLQDLAQNHRPLTPAMQLALADGSIDWNEVLQANVLSPYNLRDSTYKYIWFSNGWELSNKTFYTNDCNLGKPLLILGETDETLGGNFVNDYKEERNYHANGNLKEYKFFTWNLGINNWFQNSYSSYNEANLETERWSKNDSDSDGSTDSGSRIVSVYEMNTKILNSTEYQYDPISEDWFFYKRTTYDYMNDKLKTKLVQNFDPNFGVWSNFERTTYNYDNEGKGIGFLIEQFMNGSWQNASRQTFVYNSNDQRIEALTEVYSNGDWANTELWEASYHSNGLVNTTITYEWLEDLQDWVEFNKIVRDEDGGYSLLQYRYSFDVTSGGYEFGFRLIYTNNADLNIEKLIVNDLTPLTVDEWINFDSVLYTYNLDGRLETELSHRWDETLNDYQFSQKYEYYNTGCLFSEATEHPGQNAVCTFANPIQAGQTIDCPMLDANKNYRLDLFSMTGARLHSQAFQSGQVLSAIDVAPGMYLMTIYDGQGYVQRNKVIIGR